MCFVLVAYLNLVPGSFYELIEKEICDYEETAYC